MKIGIITYWESDDNYGQLLQAYALQQVLKAMHHEPFLIRYSESLYRFAGWKAPLRHFREAVMGLVFYNQPAYRYQRFNKQRGFTLFRRTYLASSAASYYTLDQLRQNPPVADVYITGSDQVWARLLDHTNNEAYFLNFGPVSVRRISYAASIARTSYPSELMPKFAECLARFSAISVREKSNVAICQAAGYEADVVLDPTLLLTATSYAPLVSLVSSHRENRFAFIYVLNIKTPEEIAWQELLTYLKGKDLLPITTVSTGYFPGSEFLPHALYRYATIPEWLSYIQHAAFVVTTSFHGVVFCLLFHTPFVYIPLEGAYSGGNNRVEDLLQTVSLPRIYRPTRSFSSILSTPIDWPSVDTLLQQARAHSLSFLSSALQPQ